MLNQNYMPIEIKFYKQQNDGLQLSYNIDLYNKTLHHKIDLVACS